MSEVIQSVNIEKRQPKLFVVTGGKGVGKTYRSTQEIEEYCRHDHGTGRLARPVIIVDVNNEYAQYHTLDFNVELEDDYLRGGSLRAVQQPIPRRILPYTKSMRPMTMEQLQTTLITVGKNFTGGLFLAEDINKYVVNTAQTEIISLLVGLRHVGLDVMIHLQSASAITPRLFQNTNVIRMHYETDSVDRLKTRQGVQFEILKLAQLIVNHEYFSGNKYYCQYIDYENQKLICATEEQLERALQTYLTYNEKEIKTLMKIRERASGSFIYKTEKEALDAWYSQKMRYIQ